MFTTKATITNLLEAQKGVLSGSIYMPTHPDSSSQNMTADRTRFKNALKQIRQHADYDAKLLDETLLKLDKLYEDIEFWKHRDLGLAILFNTTMIEHFKLPFEVTEAVYLKDHFVISPLLVMDAADTSFYLLDINFTNPRLFYGTHGMLKEVGEDVMPGSLDDAVGKDEYQKQLQTQHGGATSFHGHTVEDTVDDEQRRYLKLVASAVDTHIRGKHVPLLLAGTTNRTASLRKELEYGSVISGSYFGNVEKLSVHQLYDAVAPIVDNHFARERKAAVERFKGTAPQLVAVGKKEIIDITVAERGGRIDSLFLPIYRMTRDSVRPGDNVSAVIELPQDIELIEDVVTAVARHGGKIVPVEIDAYEFLDQPKALCRY